MFTPSQLSHKGKVLPKKAQKKTPTTSIILFSISHGNSCFCFCEWQLADNSMWTAKIFLLHRRAPKLITVKLRWQKNQRQDGMEKGSRRLGERREDQGEGGVFAPPYSNASVVWFLIHFRRSRSSPAKHLFNPKTTFNNTGSGTRTAQLMAH